MLLRGDGTQMFKEVENQTAVKSFERSARRVRNATGATAVYEERIRGILEPPQLSRAYFSKPDTVVWTFGRLPSEPVDPQLALRARDGRCIERMLEASGFNTISRYGKHWIRRTRGTAMGRTESPLKAELVFGGEERLRMGNKPRLRKEGFLQQGEEIGEVIAGVRYVDDLLLMSRCL